MPAQRDEKAVKIIDGCGWFMVAVVLLLAVACFVGIVWLALYLNL